MSRYFCFSLVNFFLVGWLSHYKLQKNKRLNDRKNNQFLFVFKNNQIRKPKLETNKKMKTKWENKILFCALSFN